MTLVELIDAFLLAQEARGLAPASVRTYRDRLTMSARVLARRACVGVPTSEDLDAVLLHLRSRGRSRHTIRGVRMTLRLFGNWLQTRGHAAINPACDLRLSEVPSRDLPVPPLSEAEAAELLEGVPRGSVIDLRNRAHLGLLYSCGLRLQESASLRLDDLDLEARTLLVHGKGGNQRLMPILAPELRALSDYLALRRSLLRGPDVGWLWLTRWGRPLQKCSFQRWLKGHSEGILGKSVNPHLLRHSIAVHLLRGGADIRHVQVFLGHADIDTTKVYLRMVTGHLKADYEAAMSWLG